MSKPSIPSPARSDGAAAAPRRHQSRRTLSVASPAKSDTSAKLVSLIAVSPFGRRSVLPDDTEIDAPRRASWWKRLDGSSRDVLEALDTNKMPFELPFEEEVELEKEKQSESLPESSGNESVASIKVPQRRLFSTKPQPPSKFGEMMGSRKSLGRTNLDDDNTIYHLPKNLFNKDKPRNRPVFPAALLNSTNKTFSKTIEPDVNERQGRNLFGQSRTKRKKNMFTNFVMSESEDDSEIQHKVFGFKKNDKRISSGTRKRRMPSLTPSVTTDIDMDDWNLLPSSTMIGNGSGQLEVSRITNNDESEGTEIEHQDVTLTEENHHNTSTSKKRSLNRTRFSKSKKYDDAFDKTLTNEDIEREQASEKLDNSRNNEQTSKHESEQEIQVEEMEQEEPQSEQEMEESEHEVQVEEIEQEKTQSEQEMEESKLEGQLEEIEQEEPQSEQEMEESAHEVQVEGIEQEEPQSEQEMEESEHEVQVEEIEQEEPQSEQEMEESEHEVQVAEIEQEEPQSEQEMEESEHEAQVEEIEQEEPQSKQVVAVSNNVNAIESVINASHKNVESPVDVIDHENDVVEETPNSSFDATGRNKKKDVTPVKSPEAVLQNTSIDMSFRPIGRSTSFRKSKIVTDDVNSQHTLIPIQESISGSDGSRNSSTEGSGWDSHRTTRKTLRQTFGKDFTPRKSLRALVMERSAKRQTETDKKASKINKTGNKTVLEDQRIRDKRVSNRNMSTDQLPHTKSPALGISAHHVSDPQISKPKVSYRKSVQDISEAEMPNREESINILARIQAPDDSGPEISMHASYGSGMSVVGSHQESNNISVKRSHDGTVNKSTAIKQAPERIDANVQEQEELDYDPSLQEDSTQNSSRADKSNQRNIEAEVEILDREDSTPTISEQRAEKEVSEKENSEPEASDQEIETESENEIEAQESDQEVEPNESQDEAEPRESEEEIEADESEQEIQVEELEQEAPQSEQEMEESENEVQVEQIEQEDSQSEQEMEESEYEVQVEETEQEEPQSEQEMEESEHEVSQEIEAESDREESQQIMENESDHDGSEQNVSQESVNVTQEESDEPSRDMDSELESNGQEDSVPIESPSRSSRQTERIVFDNEMSEQEIDYEVSERVSRQITNDDISEQVSEGEVEEEIEYSRHSNQAETQNVSVGTKKSLMMIQMERIAQENMQMRLKIREKVQNSLKHKRDFNRFMSPNQSKFSIGRIKKPEPKKPTRKPRKPAALLMGPLPKEFMEDLKYKPPKRFQPANAPWITKRLYNFLESKLEPKYDYRARVRAEELVQNIYSLTKLARRHDVAPQGAVDELKREMARLNVVTTHFDFYEFFHEFMPREVRVKVNPDIVNKIPMPRNGVFADILQARQAVG